MSIHYCSCDIDPDLKPDVTGSVTSLPFEERTFDVACCFEVLEHLPIEQLKLALLQLKRVTREYILLSVPDVSPHVAFSIQHILLSQFKVPSLKKIFSNPIYSLFKRKYWMLFCSLPAIFKQKHRFRGEHYWELGKRDFSHQWFAEEIIACELHIIQHFRNWHNPYHHFYVLKVSK